MCFLKYVYNLLKGMWTWFTIMYSILKISFLLLKNNNVYQDRAKKEQVSKSEVQNIDGNFCSRIGSKIKILIKYTITPLFKVVPSFLFRLLSYLVILGYISETFTGIALIIPFMIFALVAGISFYIGAFQLQLKRDEAIVNSLTGLIAPMYIDLHMPVIKILNVILRRSPFNSVFLNFVRA